MIRNREQAGRLSRNKGKAFERRCCKEIMPLLTGWKYWKRTQRGDKQYFGDLAACDEKGMEIKGTASCISWYVECRTRAVLSAKEIRKWLVETRQAAEAADAIEYALIVKQNHGPIWVFGDGDDRAEMF